MSQYFVLFELNACRYFVYVKECWLVGPREGGREWVYVCADEHDRQQAIGDENNSLRTIYTIKQYKSINATNTRISSNTKRLFLIEGKEKFFTIFKMIALESFWLENLRRNEMNVKCEWRSQIESQYVYFTTKTETKMNPWK